MSANLNWRTAQANEKPLIVEELSGDRYLVRRNITEKENSEGNKYYEYEERIVTSIELTIIECFNNMEIKREAEIIDDYTMQLIEEGVI